MICLEKVVGREYSKLLYSESRVLNIIYGGQDLETANVSLDR